MNAPCVLSAGSLALIPPTLDASAAGKEILYPVATVILGGLLSSTLLDSIVTPVVFHQFGKRALATYFKNKNQCQLNTDDTPLPIARFSEPNPTEKLM